MDAMSSRTAATVLALLIVGTASVAAGAPAPPATPVYQYSTGPLFFYSNSSVPPAGFTTEGNVFYTLPPGTADTLPFRRFYSGTAGHFYSTEDEGLVGFSDDCKGCTIGNIATTQLAGTVPLFRLRHPTGRNYFYTISTDVRDTQLTAGWRSEGTAGFVYDTNRTVQIGPTTAFSEISVYRRDGLQAPGAALAPIVRSAGVTLEARLRVDSEASRPDCNSTGSNQPCISVEYGGVGREAVQITLTTDDNRAAILQIGNERMLVGTTKISHGTAFDETLEHTYRIVIPAAVGTTSATTFKLYIDGVLKGSSFALLTGTTYAPNKNRVLFGDGTSGGASQSRWKYLRYTNTAALAPTEPVWSVSYSVDLGLPDGNGWTDGTTAGPPVPALMYTAPPVAAAAVSQSPIHRFVKGNYLYSTDAAGESSGYTSEGNFFALLPAGPDTVPLHRYRRNDVGHYLGTTRPTDAASSTGILSRWTHTGSLGWISTVARADLVPLYRYLMATGTGSNGTHFYSTVDSGGFEKIVGYVLPVLGVIEPAAQ